MLRHNKEGTEQTGLPEGWQPLRLPTGDNQNTLVRYDAFVDLRVLLQRRRPNPTPDTVPEALEDQPELLHIPNETDIRAVDQTTEEVLPKFKADRENSHDPMVTVTVSESLSRLQNRYGEDFKKNIAIAYNEIQHIILSLPKEHPHKARALDCLSRITDFKFPDIKYNLTHLETLALVWQAINDYHTVPSDVHTDPESLLRIRREALIECLYEAETTGNFNNGKACDRGVINKMVEALDKGHPDVHIAKGSPRETAYEMAFAFLAREFNALPLAKQKHILEIWDHNVTPNPKIEFINLALAHTEKDLKRIFTSGKNAVLKVKQIETIINSIQANLEYIKPFNVYPGLIELIDQINSYDENFNPRTKELAQRLRAETKASYHNDLSFQEIYRSLMPLLMATTELKSEELAKKVADNLTALEMRRQKFTLSDCYQNKFIRACRRSLLSKDGYPNRNRAFIILMLQQHPDKDLRECVSKAQPYRTAEQIKANLDCSSFVEKYQMAFDQILACDTEQAITKQLLMIINNSIPQCTAPLKMIFMY